MARITKFFSVKILYQFLFFGFSWLYLGVYCSDVLRFVEQLRLFEFDSYYFLQIVSHPGGIFEYLSEFVAQFFYIPLLGALIMSFVYIVIQSLFAKLIFKSERFYVLSFIPSALLLLLQTDTASQVALPLGILCAFFFLLLYRTFKVKKLSRFAPLVLVILLFFISPGYTLFFYFILFIYEVGIGNIRTAFVNMIMLSVVLVVLILISYKFIFISSTFSDIVLANLPGLEILMTSAIVLHILLACIIVFLLLTNRFLNNVNIRFANQTLKLWNMFFFVLIFSLVYIFSFSNFQVRNILKMDNAVITEDWSKILELADGIEKPSQLETYFTNIALCKSGKMSESLFRYNQLWQTDGLFLKFEGNSLNTFFGGEVYYQLGMLNYAYRWAMEAMIMNNNKKSGRMLKRMIEICIVNGEWKLAQKYISTLKKTLFYATYAIEYESLIQNKTKLNQAELLINKFQLLPKVDFLSGDETSTLIFLSHYLAYNQTNKYVADYFMAGTLLCVDIDSFMKGFKNLSLADGGKIPRTYEEALIIIASQSRGNNLPDIVFSEKIKSDYIHFNEIIRRNAGEKEMKENLEISKLNKTFWYYIFLNKTNS
jgi:hypothetical protein